ncbi:hypothetical protein SeMB42_g05919 [Synchytrium endobioticum]|uniref:Uncharacterized protein n=1 Tax=Synchytrium endobioticum TaxID=286115 RepID=A0A507CNB8_9FUNG|nr:hypothetical protein SeMB42_g05919 [Synchytrium endobioticum]
MNEHTLYPFPAQLESTCTAKLSSIKDPPRARAWPIVPLSAPTADCLFSSDHSVLIPLDVDTYEDPHLAKFFHPVLAFGFSFAFDINGAIRDQLCKTTTQQISSLARRLSLAMIESTIFTDEESDRAFLEAICPSASRLKFAAAINSVPTTLETTSYPGS